MLTSGARRILPTDPEQEANGPLEVAKADYAVGNNNRWSRAVLNFQNLTADAWCELSFQLEWHPDEENRSVQDFAAIGVEFLTDDGSSIDFAYVPGLIKAQIDPHCHYVPGPDYHRSDAQSRSCSLRFGFLAPSPATQLAISMRSWRNSHPFTIRNPELRQSGPAHVPEDETAFDRITVASPLASRLRAHWPSLGTEPTWFNYALVPGRRLFVRGQVINEKATHDDILTRVVFRDAQGEELPPPYDGTTQAPGLGAFISISTHKQARRFTLELIPPPQAASVDLGFQILRDEAEITLMTPLEISLEDDLLLENILGDDQPDALAFLKRAVGRLNPPFLNRTDLQHLMSRKHLASAFSVHDCLKRVQLGERLEFSAGELRLDARPNWPLPQAPTWTEDPFQSVAWRLDYQSLSWLTAIASDPEAGGLTRAFDLALSWSKANPGTSPADIVSAHPRSIAVRAEALLLLLSHGAREKRKIPPEHLLTLFAEVIRHGFSLAQIIGQNIFSHSIHQLHAACTLLTIARATPQVPFSAYWMSLALSHIRHSIDELIGSGGSSIEQSWHYRLEAASLGLILLQALEGLPQAHDLRQHLISPLTETIRVLIGLIDPAGMLPPFGDAPLGSHHAPWVRRLMVEYGHYLLPKESISSELSYPQGFRVSMSQEAGAIAARYYERNPNWGYLCTSLNGLRHEHGHLDCTSFVYAADGQRWVADPGGAGLSETGITRHYLGSARAHNVAVPDGREQMVGEAWLRSHLSIENGHVLEIGTNVHGPDYAHRRIIVTLDNLRGAAVFDHFVKGSAPVSFEGFLHFESDVTAAIVNPRLIMAFQGKRRLRIIPYAVSGTLGGVSIENGRYHRPSSMQGFLSRQPGALSPANVLGYTFKGQHSVCGGVVMAVGDHSLEAIYGILESPPVKKLLLQSSA